MKKPFPSSCVWFAAVFSVTLHDPFLSFSSSQCLLSSLLDLPSPLPRSQRITCQSALAAPRTLRGKSKFSVTLRNGSISELNLLTPPLTLQVPIGNYKDWKVPCSCLQDKVWRKKRKVCYFIAKIGKEPKRKRELAVGRGDKSTHYRMVRLILCPFSSLQHLCSKPSFSVSYLFFAR